MSPTNERRKKTILEWALPAALGIIGVLILLGGGELLSSMHDQTNETRGLRHDLVDWKEQYFKDQLSNQARFIPLEEFKRTMEARMPMPQVRTAQPADVAGTGGAGRR
jgi:hypothetical protein